MSFRGNISPGQILGAGAIAAGLPLALLGLAESQYYAPKDLAAALYGFSLYGAAGLVYGFLYAFLFGGKGRRNHEEFVRFGARTALLPTLALSALVGGFLVYRDLWQEVFPPASVWGWLALVVLPIVIYLLVLVARLIGRGLCEVGQPASLALVLLVAAGLTFGPGGDALPELDPAVGQAADKTVSHPPIILIVVDALRADALGVHGAGASATPNLDAFAQEAVDFTECWAAATWTRPSVASLLTGRYPSEHRTIHKSDRLPADMGSLPAMLQEQGYVTLASVTNVNLAPIFGMGRGFDAYAYHGPRPFFGAPVSASRLFLVELGRLARLRFFSGHREVFRYYAEGELINRTALQLITPVAQSGRPFFAYLHYMEPHDPYFAHPYDGNAVARVENPNPAIERAPELLGLYQQEVRHWDNLFGELAASLKATGVYDRALIIVTSDHGEEFGDHGGFWHGTTLYQELVHVPLLVRYPAGQQGGSKRHEPVSLVDLVPTILQTVGAQAPADLPGRSLRQPASARTILAEVDHQGAVLTAVRSGLWKLVVSSVYDPRGQPKKQLFDLNEDPAERKNLAASQSKDLERLLQLMQGRPAASAAEGAQAEEVEIDPETEEQLRSLGYTE